MAGSRIRGMKPRKVVREVSHNRTKTPFGAFYDRGSRRIPFPQFLIDEIHHDQGIVHHNTAQAEDSHEGYRAQGQTQDPVTQYHSDETEGG